MARSIEATLPPARTTNALSSIIRFSFSRAAHSLIVSGHGVRDHRVSKDDVLEVWLLSGDLLDIHSGVPTGRRLTASLTSDLRQPVVDRSAWRHHAKNNKGRTPKGIANPVSISCLNLSSGLVATYFKQLGIFVSVSLFHLDSDCCCFNVVELKSNQTSSVLFNRTNLHPFPLYACLDFK